MTSNSLRRALFVVAFFASACAAANVQAACCGGGRTAAYYPSAGYNAGYAPAYTTSYYGSSNYGGGWYPGYWLNRVSARLWGSPSTYVASYPSSYHSASYAPSYSVGYQPAYSSGYATSYAAPSGCASCSNYSASYAPVSTYAAPCSSCTSAVTLRPVCSSGCDPCSGGASYGASAVTQTSYVERAAPGCASCGGEAVVTGPPAAAPPQHFVVPAPHPNAAPAPTPAPPQTFSPQSEAPSGEAPSADPNTPTERQLEAQRPATDESQDIQPEPVAEPPTPDPYKTNKEDSSTFFQAPKLFDPNDRTAQRHIAPVITALYEKPVSYRNVSAGRITRDQAEADATGWISASN